MTVTVQKMHVHGLRLIVTTANGEKPVESLEEDDTIMDHAGKSHKITRIVNDNPQGST